MCGIVGYVGGAEAADVILDALSRLEYRGYDSAGLTVFNGERLEERKCKGRLKELRRAVEASPVHGHSGIGHTRWATHGEPNDVNAHPHFSFDRKVSIIHNGIIENYLEIKERLMADGVTFVSETDSEVVAHLIAKKYKGDILKAASECAAELRGAYALVIICEDEPGKLVAVRKDSPIVIGLGKGENFVASDIPAILERTRDVYLLENGSMALVTADSVSLYDEKLNPLVQDVTHVEWSATAATKGGYEHFMLKEINEQPAAIRDTLLGRFTPDSREISLEGFDMGADEWAGISRVYIVACGTAYYAGAFGKMLIEKYARKPVEVEIASEFRYRNPIIGGDTLFIGVSQSGETSDTLECLRLAKRSGARTLAITNVLGSSIYRESGKIIHTAAGPEIAVASTKAYSTQVACLAMMALRAGILSGNTSPEAFDSLRQALMDSPDAVQRVLDRSDEVKAAARGLAARSDVFFIGRGADYCLALEGSLKLKEISYIHSEAFPGGELKHGPIALLEKGSQVIAVCTQKGEISDKIFSNIKEVKSRGARVLAITQRANRHIASEADETLFLDDCHDDAAILPAAAVLQLLAYHAAIALGRDVDMPRNLAKSVTVE